MQRGRHFSVRQFAQYFSPLSAVVACMKKRVVTALTGYTSYYSGRLLKARQHRLYRRTAVSQSLQMLVGNIICICPRLVLSLFIRTLFLYLLSFSFASTPSPRCRCCSSFAKTLFRAVPSAIKISHGDFLGDSLLGSSRSGLKNAPSSGDVTDFKFNAKLLVIRDKLYGQSHRVM